MKLNFSSDAQQDLSDIADWIAADDPRVANRFVVRLEAKARGIVDMPLAYGFAPGLRSRGVRKRNHGKYLILYRVERGAVLILRIVDGRRDYATLFGTS